MTTPSATNAVTIEAWNTVLFDKFVRFRHLLTQGLAGHSDAALAPGRYRPGDRVLDIGCGFGDCTVQIAGLVGRTGEAVGIDCAARFVEDAGRTARERGVGNASFLQRDVESEDLQGPYDHAFSRFGTMFFARPGVAFRNVLASLRPGGSFTQVVWRRREDNPWLHEAERCVKKLLPPVERPDAIHCGPGPFSLADDATLTALLEHSGFSNVSLERHDCDICIGRDVDEAVSFALMLGPAGEAVRLAEEEGQKKLPELKEALAGTLAAFHRPDGVWAPSSTWIARADAGA